jgi:outer membrane protein assembly factor BamE (lipoprotein component of BamABCDE complex)
MGSSIGGRKNIFFRRVFRTVPHLIAGLALVVLVSCQPVYRNHGYAPTDIELATLEVGRDTKETVAEKVGIPSAAGLLNDTAWFYVQSRWLHRGFQAPRELEREVIVISFNDGGTVQNVERFGLEDGQVVALSRRVTESNIEGVTFIRQLMGNFGRLTSEQLVGK